MSVQDPEVKPSMDLPLPIDPAKRGEQATKQGSIERTPETLPAEPLNITAQPQAQAAGVQPQIPAGQIALPSPKADDVSATMPQIADDVDLIEKEWVQKAKEIVAKTKDDPKVQSEELDKVKVDYKKKRFNKNTPVGRGQ